MKTVYGPIDSWRLQRSLGIDLISQEGRVCTFDCIYCQIKRCQEITAQRRKFVKIEEVREELVEALQKIGDKVDYLTLSGMGEPTLAANLDEGVEMIGEVSNKPRAILTNGSLLNLEDVRRSLEKLDYVIASLDAAGKESFAKVNGPHEDIDFDEMIEGFGTFGERFDGTFALELMLVQENKHLVEEMADLVSGLKVDEVQLNTPLRPAVVEPLKEEELEEMKKYFEDVSTKMVYEAKRTDTPDLNEDEIIRRGRSKA